MIDEGKFLASGLMRIGTTYIWGAKGRRIWTPEGGRPLKEVMTDVEVAYDCSGLVTCMLRDAGHQDWTMTHNAALLMDAMPVSAQNIGLAFFSPDAGGRPRHVGVFFRVGYVNYLLEAAGGDRTTTTLEAAKKRGAFVRCGVWDIQKRPAFTTRGLPF